jgi:hypothetical protein
MQVVCFVKSISAIRNDIHNIAFAAIFTTTFMATSSHNVSILAKKGQMPPTCSKKSSTCFKVVFLQKLCDHFKKSSDPFTWYIHVVPALKLVRTALFCSSFLSLL